MARGKVPLLGIDISATEVRVVEHRTGSRGEDQLYAWHSSPLPDGAVIAGAIQRPDIVGGVIGSALHAMGTKTRDAVYSLTGESVITRVIEVPPVPDVELRTIVEGEVQHFQMLRQGSGSFDYVKLGDSPSKQEHQVLVLAVDGPVLDPVEATSKVAGTRLNACEPIQIGLLRNAGNHLGADETVIVLIVTDLRCEIVVVERMVIRMYRSLDYVGDSLVPAGDSGDEFASGPGGALATELSRSVEYYDRENPASGGIRAIVYVASSERFHPFGTWLQKEMRLPTRISGLPAKILEPLEPELSVRESLDFAAAWGLAAGRGEGAAAWIAPIDISRREYVPPDVVTARQGLTASLVASLLMIAAGVSAGFYYGGKAGPIVQELEHLKGELANLQRTGLTQADDRLRELSELRALAGTGVSLPQLMDSISAAIDPGVGLESVDVDELWMVKITGEAMSEGAMINTLERLRQFPEFQNTSVVSFQSIATEGNRRGGLRFEISAQFSPTRARAGVTPR